MVTVAENDILHDEDLDYARKLDLAGVPTTIVTYNGLIHDYGLLNPLQNVDAVTCTSKQEALALKNALFSEK